jgi:hypothetical protein
MVSWFIIILAAIGVFIVYKLVTYKHRRPRIFMIILLIIILLFVGSLYLVSKANNVDMTNISGFMDGMKTYGMWIVSKVTNMGSMTGYFVVADSNLTKNTKTGNLTKNANNINKSTTLGMKPKPLK